MNQYEEQIKLRAMHLDIELNDNELNMLYSHMEKVLETNEKFNLTSIKNRNEYIDKHIIDSLSILQYISNKGSFVDIGSGAGYPGLAIKICKLDLKVILLDSTRKKVDFLNKTISEINLDKTKAIHCRVEEAGRNQMYREKFNVGTARAVSFLPVLLEYGLPLIEVGGIFIAMKGKDVKEEINSSKKALNELGGEIKEVNFIKIPGTEYKRNIIIIKKIRQNSLKYPRKVGLPLKNPII